MLSAQDIKLFKIGDFDLNGTVKTCTVVTNYGKEIFEFDELGYLVKSTTKYNDVDMDVTRYKYQNEQLLEKRMESYKENTLDASSSLVNFYEIDTTGLRYVKETIVSLDKEFFEQQEYYYDVDAQLTKIVTSHENAVDERVLERTQFKDETTVTLFENGVIQKSTRKSTKKRKTAKPLQITLLKQFVDGDPATAVEQIHDDTGKLISEHFFNYDVTEEEFVVDRMKVYAYNDEGILKKETIKMGEDETQKEYIFQFDDNTPKNWVKKIITPDNTYTTRIITYYEPLPLEEEENN